MGVQLQGQGRTAAEILAADVFVLLILLDKAVDDNGAGMAGIGVVGQGQTEICRVAGESGVVESDEPQGGFHVFLPLLPAHGADLSLGLRLVGGHILDPLTRFLHELIGFASEDGRVGEEKAGLAALVRGLLHAAQLPERFEERGALRRVRLGAGIADGYVIVGHGIEGTHAFLEHIGVGGHRYEQHHADD